MLAAILNSRREAFNFQASEQQQLQNSAGGMDDPVAEITEAINRCAGASTADEQILAFHQHFLKHASFLHPLCYVPSRPDSRRHIIGIFMFYRSVVYETHFDVTHIAFDERPNGKEGKLFVDLLQTPKFRLWTTFTGFAPPIPMHIFFDVEKHEGKWWIVAEEDVIQPMSLMLAIPGLSVIGRLFYTLCEVMGLLNAWLSILLGIWRPAEHIRRAKKLQ